MTAATVRSHLSAIFARWGCPTVMVTDNGPQLGRRLFQDFAKAYDFQHVTVTAVVRGREDPDADFKKVTEVYSKSKARTKSAAEPVIINTKL